MADLTDSMLDSLIGQIYAAADGSVPWAEAIEALRVAFAAKSAILHGPDEAGQYVMIGRAHLPDEVMRPYAEHWYAQDPWISAAARHPAGRAYSGQMLVPFAEMRRSAFYAEWMGPVLGVADALGGIAGEGRGTAPTLGLLQASGRDAYERRHLDAMQRLLPHVGRAVAIERRFARHLATAGDAMAALDALGHGVVLCRADGRVRFANVAARRLHERHIGLHVDARIGATPAAIDAMLRSAIAEVARSRGPARGFRLPCPDGSALLLTLVALGAAARSTVPDRQAEVLVLIAAREAPATADRIAALFALSRVEAEVAAALAAGIRPEAIAQARGVRISTVRTQVAQIFAKTGTAGQAEFVRLAASLPPVTEN